MNSANNLRPLRARLAASERAAKTWHQESVNADDYNAKIEAIRTMGSGMPSQASFGASARSVEPNERQ